MDHAPCPRSGRCRPTGRALRGTVAALAAGIAVACSAAAPVAPPAPDPPAVDQLVARTTGDGAYTHLQALAAITQANGGNRATGGPAYDASVDHVAAVLRDAGFDVSTPTFVLERDGRRGEYRNVVAQTRTGDPRRAVMAGAHLDSVRRGLGMDDNGTGVASLLEIATRMGGSPPVTRAVRFGFWGAEEIDYEGSRDYVDSLSGNESPVFYLNLDMVGAPNAGYFVQGASGGPDGSATVAADLTRRFVALGVAPDPMDLDGSSDYDPFVNAGIPSAGLLAGDSEHKSADQARRWGGEQGEVFDRCYHSACDDLTNVDRLALDRFTDVAAGTLAYFASTGDLP